MRAIASLADPALPEAAADHDALGIGPRLGLEEPAASHRPAPGRIPRSRHAPGRRRRHRRPPAPHRGRSWRISSVDFLPKGSSPFFFSGLRSAVQDLAESALAGAVAEKTLVVLQFDIEAVDLDRRQPGGAVAGDARGRYGVFCHVALSPCRISLATTGGEPIGFMEQGESRMATQRSANGPSLLAIRHSRQILHFWPVFGPLCLDSRLSAAISPRIRRGISRAACFCANSEGLATPAARKSYP